MIGTFAMGIRGDISERSDFSDIELNTDDTNLADRHGSWMRQNKKRISFAEKVLAASAAEIAADAT